jgi:hypothetical protein
MSRYMLIMRVADPAAAEAAMAGIDFDEIIASMGRYNEELIKAGVMLAGEGLTGPEDGFVVDFDADPPVVTDGPYAEAKEYLGSFTIVDCDSSERALEIAARNPSARYWGVEVRPLMHEANVEP